MVGVRKGVSEALLKAKGGSVQILIAPTGYGKTSSVHHAWNAVSERWGRVVHVLPLRAIVSDAASKAVERGVPLEEVSYQAAIDEVLTGEGERVPKSSYMFSRYVVTTYDSFSFSLYAAPVAELSRVHAHRDVGLLAAAGGVLFDEAHLVMATDEADASEEEYKVFTVLCHEIEVLSRHLQRPVVLATATLPAPVVGGFLEALRGLEARIHLCLGERGLEYYRGYGLPVEEHGLDPDFGKHYEEYRKRVRTRVSRGSLEDDALKALEEYSRVAVFCNTVARAVEVYRKLKSRADAEVILIHGRFTGVDKSGKIDRVELLLKSGGRVLVVSTQVLEAGVDFDFDAVVTEVAAPGALVQRAGRAYRNLEERCGDGGLITVNVSDESLRSAEAVYPSEPVSAAAQYLSSALSGEGFFDWRFAESKPCFADLLAAVKASPSVDYSLYTSLNNLVRFRLLSESIGEILRELDEWLEGALVRDSALVPVLTERGIVTVSLDYLRGKGRRVLELEDGKAKAVFSDGSYRRVDLQRLFASPLATLYRLAGSGE
ncbi:MAG: CRISPR-associated helicase Cas3', partial [Thermofilaceae archaeon]